MKNCPCEKCLCLPVCRQKKYGKLIMECETVWRYINKRPYSYLEGTTLVANLYLNKVFNTLKPKTWNILK